MLRETIRDQRWMTNGRRLDFWLGLKPNTPVLHVYGILHVVAAVLLTELVGLFCTNEVKASRLPETDSPAFFLASTSALYNDSTFSRSVAASEHCTVKG